MDNIRQRLRRRSRVALAPRSPSFVPNASVPSARSMNNAIPPEYAPGVLIQNGDELQKCMNANAGRWLMAYKQTVLKANFRDNLEGIAEDCRTLLSKTKNLEWQTRLGLVRNDIEYCLGRIPRPSLKPVPTWFELMGILLRLEHTLVTLVRLIFVMQEAQTGINVPPERLATMGKKVSNAALKLQSIQMMYADVFMEKGKCTGTRIQTMALGTKPAPKPARKGRQTA